MICLAASHAGAEILADRPDTPVTVDWRLGYVYAWAQGAATAEASRISVKLIDGGESAWTAASEALAAASQVIGYDANRLVGDLMEGETGRKSQRVFRRYVAGAEPAKVYYRPDASVGTWIRAPLYGVGGLAGLRDKRTIDRDERMEIKAAANAPGGVLVLEVSGGVGPRPVLWPVILWPSKKGPPTDAWANLTNLSKEGLLPPDFKIHRLRRSETGQDAGLPAWKSVKPLAVAVAANGADLILGSAPPLDEAFNPYAYRSMVILEP